MAMELECRRSSDNNWYHCQISIGYNGGQNVLKVHFSEEGEECILTPSEAQSRLRPASKCLEKGECRRLHVGDMVLVPSHKMESGKSGFFEAQIRDICRHQHSAMETCNCTLEIASACTMKDESSNVPASQVRLINSSSSIHDNPVFRDWIGSSTTYGPYRLDTSDAESDMHAQLDEQINKITMMTDSFNETSSSTTQFLEDAATRTPRTRSRSRRNQSSPYVEHGRRLRKELSNGASPLDKQPRLSPLAARAALAATVLTQPPRQVNTPSVPEPQVLCSQSSKSRSGSRPVRVAKNALRKSQRVKGRNSRAKEKETSIDLTIDVPIFRS